MNRLTAIGLASLVAYGLLVASKYTGVISLAGESRTATRSATVALEEPAPAGRVEAMNPEPRPVPITLPPPIPRAQPHRPSPVALEFRNSRDLKAFADGLGARRGDLGSDERYYLARTLEECQFATTINQDLAAYSARKKREFLASLPVGDAMNPKRIAAYEAVDNTQRCLGFQNVKISPRDIEELYRGAAQMGDARAQARLITAELSAKNNNAQRLDNAQTTRQQQGPNDDVSRLIQLLESHEPDALLTVGDYLSRQSSQLRVGPNGEVPEPSAFLGAFSLVACDLGQDCSSSHREPLQACAYAGYCNAQNFEELYQNFLASPWAYTQATRYRGIIHTAISTRNWALIGLVPPQSSNNVTPQ